MNLANQNLNTFLNYIDNRVFYYADFHYEVNIFSGMNGNKKSIKGGDKDINMGLEY